MDVIEAAIEGVKEDERLWEEDGIPAEPRRAEGQVGDYEITLRLMSYEGHAEYACNLFAEASPVTDTDQEVVPANLVSLPYQEYETGRNTFERLVTEYQLDTKQP